MTDADQDHKEQEPRTVDDLPPRDDESAELKGGWGLVVGTHGKPKS
jgi:hypothetical protein